MPVLAAPPRHAPRRTLRRGALLAAGLALRVVAEFLTGGVAAAAAMAGLALLLAFLAENRHLAGTGVVAVGVVLNLAVIGVNGAMPVEPGAAARISGGDSDVSFRGPRRLADDGDRLRALDDRFVLGNQAVSAGDLILLAGLADLAVHLVRRARRPA